ncbi:MAG: HlyD family efflux transporter periplasmic adaptor subunit [Planctomycetes bacterium]|nr:HlyD family efflux transporter periplasmic adaptor subunit [Planctomycetota bacterium]
MVWLKRILLVLVALAVLGAVAYGFMPKPVAVDTAAVTRGELLVTVDNEGRCRVKDRFVLYAPVHGRLGRITLKAGDSVAGNALVAVLTASPAAPLDARLRAQAEAELGAAEAARKQAESAFTGAEAELSFAAAEVARHEKLLLSRNTTQEALDAARTRRTSAQAARDSASFGRDVADYRVQAARAALTAGDSAPGTVEVRSPVAGRVLRVLRESEGAVAAGEPLLEVGDPAALEAVTDLLSRDAVKVQPKMPVRLERWGGDSVLNGRVRLIEPHAFTKLSALGVEEQRVNVVIEFDEPRERYAALGDGYRVEARVVLAQATNVLKVPAGAVFNHEGAPAAFVVRNSRAELAKLQVGRRNGLEVEIVGGVTEGERVIVSPPDSIANGVAVAGR